MIHTVIEKVIYHPVRSRIIYDFTMALFSASIIFILFYIFHQQILPPQEVILFPIIFLTINYLLGIYGAYKMVFLPIKSVLLLASSFTSLLILSFLFSLSLPLVIATILNIILSVTPRIFLNLHYLESRNKNLNTIIISNRAPVLVVGGGGYIGSVLVENLLKEKMNVRVFDKFLYGKDVFKDIPNKKYLETVEGDISNLYELTLAVKNTQAVIHLAGIVGDQAASIDENLTRHMNIITTRMLKETVKAFNIPKFIFASSCSVYGYTNKIVNENSNLNPISLYAKTKIDSEKEILHDTFDEFHPTVLRFATVFGHSRKPRFDLVANLFTAQAFYKGRIIVTGSKQWRPFIHVDDVARAILATINAPSQKVSRQIFNVGDDRLHMRIGNLADIVTKIVGQNRKVKVVVRDKVHDRRNYKVSFVKIHQKLGFEAKTSIEQGIEEIYQNFLQGTYNKDYLRSYYNNLEITKDIIKEFYSEQYRKTHFSTMS